MNTLASATKQNAGGVASRQNSAHEGKHILQRKSNGRDAEALAQLVSRSSAAHGFHHASAGMGNSRSAHLINLVQDRPVQAKLPVGKPKDKYEQEADQMAEKVMTSPSPVIQRSSNEKGEKSIKARVQAFTIQRQEEEEPQTAPLIQKQEEEEETQTKSLIQKQQEEEEAQSRPLLQKKEEEEEETHSKPLLAKEDEEEQETQSKSLFKRREEEEEKTQGKSLLQKQEEEQEESQEKPLLQKKQTGTVATKGGNTSGNLVQPRLRSTRGSGSPLGSHVRAFMEPRFGNDFSRVRIHTDANAMQMAQELNAQAFTHGSDIYFNAGRYDPDTGSGRQLLAHELTHVIQQHAAPTLKSAVGSITQTGAGGALGAVQRNPGNGAAIPSPAVGGTEPVVAPSEQEDESDWGIFERLVPRQGLLILGEIRRKGIIGFLSERISGAVTGIFRTFGPNHAVFALFIRVFNNMVAQAREILGALASGDCRPLIAAVNRFKETVSQMAGDAWDGIKDFFRPVGEFFSDLWQSYGAPAIDWISDKAGEAWAFIRDLGRDIWAWLAPVRESLSVAWDYVWGGVKGLFGIGESEGDSEGGIIAWFQEKIGEAWSAIRETLQPVIAPIQDVVAKIKSLLPLDAILNMREAVTDWLSNVGNMTNTMEQEDGVVAQQTSLREDILPGVQRTIRSLRERLISAGQWIVGRIGDLSTKVLGLMDSLRANALLNLALSAIEWFPEKVDELSSWAQDTVANLFRWVGDGLARLSTFIEPVLNTLQQIVTTLGDLMGKLSDLVLGRFWRMIPACIRDPIKDFIINNILRHIPVFGHLLQIPDIWERVQSTAMRILRQVFVDGNLPAAAWTFFREILGILGIPPQLVTGIIGKAVAVIGDILRDPPGFLLNLVRALVRGFTQFCTNIGSNLLSGISGWLFGQLQQVGIQRPSDFSFRSILGLVLQLLGIDAEGIFRRMERHPRIGRQRVMRLRRIADRLTGAWQWVAALIREGPVGLWRMLRERLSDLWTMVLNAIVGWITTRIITRASLRLATMADPTGIGAVVNIVITIYQAIQTAVQYMRPILEAIDRFLEGLNSLVQGAIATAADRLERTLVRLLTPAIGFLANWVGAGGFIGSILETLGRARTRVWQAIDWLIGRGASVIDRILSGVRAVGGAIRRGAQRAVQWWRMRKRFRTRSGEVHTLSFRGRGRNSRLFISSNNTRPIQTIIGDVSDLAKRASMNQRVTNVTNIAGQIDQYPDSAELRSQIRTEVDELADLLAENLATSSEELPRTNVTYQKRGRPFLVLADPLTETSGNTEGTKATASSTDGQDWVRNWIDKSQRHATHLLSAKLHGPGNVDWNLVFTSPGLNSRMRTEPEIRAINLIKASGGETKKHRLRYTSRVNSYFGNQLPPDIQAKDDVAPEFARPYVEYYFCSSIEVTIDKWENSSYQRLETYFIRDTERPTLKTTAAGLAEKRIRRRIRDNHLLQGKTNYDTIIDNQLEYQRFDTNLGSFADWSTIRDQLQARSIIIKKRLRDVSPDHPVSVTQISYIRRDYIDADNDVLSQQT